jgi:hypothetical protein
MFKFPVSKVLVFIFISIILGIVLCNIKNIEKFSTSNFFYLDEAKNSQIEQNDPLHGGMTDRDDTSASSQKCPQSNFISTNLLPKQTDTVIDPAFEFAPKDLQSINFLDNKGRIGIDTQGSSLRNANYQIRDEPSNPKTIVSPWMNSTIDVDLHRKPL